MKVVAFNGSPRKEGNTYALLNYVLETLSKEGIDCELVTIGGTTIRGCLACGTCKKKQNKRCALSGDIVNSCIEKMCDSDGMLLGSPTYFSDLTAEMKALIDRAGSVGRANGHLYRRKVGAAVVAVRRIGAIHAFDSINHFFTIGQMIIPGASYWNVGLGLNEGDVHGDAEGQETMRNLGENMAWLLHKLHQGQP